jgi:hypothetical protein
MDSCYKTTLPSFFYCIYEESEKYLLVSSEYVQKTELNSDLDIHAEMWTRTIS